MPNTSGRYIRVFNVSRFAFRSYRCSARSTFDNFVLHFRTVRIISGPYLCKVRSRIHVPLYKLESLPSSKSIHFRRTLSNYLKVSTITAHPAKNAHVFSLICEARADVLAVVYLFETGSQKLLHLKVLSKSFAGTIENRSSSCRKTRASMEFLATNTLNPFWVTTIYKGYPFCRYFALLYPNVARNSSNLNMSCLKV